MDGIAGLLTAIPNVYAWPVDSITVPCAVVGMGRVQYDTTFARGCDTFTVPVWYVVGTTSTKAARDTLSAAEATIKAAVDGAHSFGDARVLSAEITEIVVSSVAYIGAKFEVEVYG